jgi:hypothetical protein
VIIITFQTHCLSPAPAARYLLFGQCVGFASIVDASMELGGVLADYCESPRLCNRNVEGRICAQSAGAKVFLASRSALNTRTMRDVFSFVLSQCLRDAADNLCSTNHAHRFNTRAAINVDEAAIKQHRVR